MNRIRMLAVTLFAWGLSAATARAESLTGTVVEVVRSRLILRPEGGGETVEVRARWIRDDGRWQPEPSVNDVLQTLQPGDRVALSTSPGSEGMTLIDSIRSLEPAREESPPEEVEAEEPDEPSPRERRRQEREEQEREEQEREEDTRVLNEPYIDRIFHQRVRGLGAELAAGGHGQGFLADSAAMVERLWNEGKGIAAERDPERTERWLASTHVKDEAKRAFRGREDLRDELIGVFRTLLLDNYEEFLADPEGPGHRRRGPEGHVQHPFEEESGEGGGR